MKKTIHTIPTKKLLIVPMVMALASCSAPPKKLAKLQGATSLNPNDTAVILSTPIQADIISPPNYEGFSFTHFKNHYRRINNRKVVSDGRYSGVAIPAGKNEIQVLSRYYRHRPNTTSRGIPKSTSQTIHYDFEKGKCYAPVMEMKPMNKNEKTCTHDVLSGKAISCGRASAYKITGFKEVGDNMKGTYFKIKKGFYTKDFKEACNLGFGS